MGSNPTSSANHISLCLYYIKTVFLCRRSGTLAAPRPDRDTCSRQIGAPFRVTSLFGASGASVFALKISCVQGICREFSTRVFAWLPEEPAPKADDDPDRRRCIDRRNEADCKPRGRAGALAWTGHSKAAEPLLVLPVEGQVDGLGAFEGSVRGMEVEAGAAGA